MRSLRGGKRVWRERPARGSQRPSYPLPGRNSGREEDSHRIREPVAVIWRIRICSLWRATCPNGTDRLTTVGKSGRQGNQDAASEVSVASDPRPAVVAKGAVVRFKKQCTKHAAAGREFAADLQNRHSKGSVERVVRGGPGGRTESTSHFPARRHGARTKYERRQVFVRRTRPGRRQR
jgi:hypothetical protein